MAFLTGLTLAEAKGLGHHFGLEITRVEPLSAGSVNSNFRLEAASGELYFGRVFEEQGPAGAAAELRLLGELCRAGIPSTLPVLPIAEGVGVTHEGKPFALYRWIAGRDLCLGQVSAAHLERLGEVLARLHLATSAVTPLPAGRFGADGLRGRLEVIAAQGRDEHRAAGAKIASKLAEYEGQRDPTIPHGVIHGDLFRDNVLWSETEIAALLDFESACMGPFVYDLMVCVWAWCYTAALQAERVSALFAGYCSVRPLSLSERAQLPIEGALACLRFATTRLTDFELRALPGETPARDYRRFLRRLEDLEGGAMDKYLEKTQ